MSLWKKRLGFIWWTFLAFTSLAFANAQLFSEAQLTDSAVRLVGIERGFTPWGFWQDFSPKEACSWRDFREQIDLLNPAFSTSNFRQIPIGTTVVVPSGCVATGLILFNETDAQSEQLFVLDEVALSSVTMELGPETRALINRLTSQSPTLRSSETSQEPSVTSTANGGVTSLTTWRTFVEWNFWFLIAIVFFVLFLLLLVLLIVLLLMSRKKLRDDLEWRVTALERERQTLYLERQPTSSDLEQLNQKLSLENQALMSEVESLRRDQELKQEETSKLLSQRNSANSRYGAAKRKLEECEQAAAFVTREDTSEELFQNEENEQSVSKKRRGGKRQKRAMEARKKKQETS